MEDAEVILTFPSCIHVGVWHQTSLLDSPIVRAVLKSKANLWAEENGFVLGSRVSEGWTLGKHTSQSRAIYMIREK